MRSLILPSAFLIGLAIAAPTFAAEKTADLAKYCRKVHGAAAFPSVDRRDNGLMCSLRTSGGRGLLHRKIAAADVCAAQEQLFTRAWRRLQEVRGSGLAVDEYPL